MLYPEENGNGTAPMSRFTIKNEPDDVQQFGVKQEQGGIIKRSSPVSLAENEIMYNTNIKKEFIVKSEITDDERHERIVNQQMKINIEPSLSATTVDFQPSPVETIAQMHLTMNDTSGSNYYGKNESKNQINMDQCIREPNTTNWDIMDIEGNAKAIWDADDSVREEKEYLIIETIKPERDEWEIDTKGACNITHKEVEISSGEEVGCNKTLKERVTQDPKHCKTFECGVCGKSFTKNYNLTVHQHIHTGEKLFECAMCKKSFTQKSHLTRHQQIHTGERPFDCAVCKKSFITRSELKVHQWIHTGEKPFECAVCKKSFVKKCHLTDHQRIHTGEKPFECVVCKKSFAVKSNLTEHQWIHTGEKPFECAVCRKTFTRQSSLTDHQRIHTGEKLFDCAVCKKSFTKKSHLTGHQRIHTLEKPFECAMCKTSFTSRSDLTRHRQIHTAEKSFECAVCKKSFTPRSHLAMHQQMHIAEKKL